MPSPRSNELPKPKGVYELRYDWWADGGVTVATGAAFLLSEVPFKRQLAPAECRWCERAAGGSDLLNGMDTWGLGARWENPRTAATLSDATMGVNTWRPPTARPRTSRWTP